MRHVEVEDSAGQVAVEAIRFVVVHSSQLAQQQVQAFAQAQAHEAVRVAEHVRRVAAQRFACAADAEEAIANYAGRGQRSEEHTSELQSRPHLVCRLLLEKKKNARAPL